jgi:TolA-binding protein
MLLATTMAARVDSVALNMNTSAQPPLIAGDPDAERALVREQVRQLEAQLADLHQRLRELDEQILQRQRNASG